MPVDLMPAEAMHADPRHPVPVPTMHSVYPVYPMSLTDRLPGETS